MVNPVKLSTSFYDLLQGDTVGAMSSDTLQHTKDTCVGRLHINALRFLANRMYTCGLKENAWLYSIDVMAAAAVAGDDESCEKPVDLLMQRPFV